MTWDRDDLHAGASNENDAYGDGSLAPAVVKRMADEIMAEDAAPSSTPLEGTGRGGPPQGYGKYGDLA